MVSRDKAPSPKEQDQDDRGDRQQWTTHPGPAQITGLGDRDRGETEMDGGRSGQLGVGLLDVAVEDRKCLQSDVERLNRVQLVVRLASRHRDLQRSGATGHLQLRFTPGERTRISAAFRHFLLAHVSRRYPGGVSVPSEMSLTIKGGEIAAKLNDRPRRIHGFRSSAEVYADFIKNGDALTPWDRHRFLHKVGDPPQRH
jgi:hypothetical protein